MNGALSLAVRGNTSGLECAVQGALLEAVSCTSCQMARLGSGTLLQGRHGYYVKEKKQQLKCYKLQLMFSVAQIQRNQEVGGEVHRNAMGGSSNRVNCRWEV